MNLSTITAVILAGGFGTRLRPVVADRPKVLAEVQGKYFLTFILDYVTKVGIECAVLCIGYRGEQIQTVLGNKYGHLRLVYSPEISPLGTAGALRRAVPFFESDTVLVINGDSMCYADLMSFGKWHEERKADASLLLARVNDVQRFGQVITDNDGRILRFEEKNNNPRPGWISAGMYMINQKLIEKIPEGIPISLEKEVFPAWIGKKFYGFQSAGQFIDIGTPESYAEANHFFSMDKLI